MNIYLMRHGAAEPGQPEGDDGSSRLTPEGRKAVESAMPGIKQLAGQVEYILCSPLVRARQTAEILGDYFKCRGFIEVAPPLADRGTEKKIISILNKLIGKDNIVVIGHVPHLVELAAVLTGIGKEESGIELKKGGMAKIYVKGFVEPGSGALRWVMTPEELARAAGG